MVRKQSFLERLTGAVEMEEEQDVMKESERTTREEAREKPWTDAVYENSESDPVHTLHETEEEEAPMVDADDTPYEDDPEYDDEESEDGQLAIDLYESENEIVIQSMIAGVTPENLHISVTRDMVTIRGVRVPPSGIPEEHYHIQELYWGSFSREIPLPVEIDTDSAEAVEKYGLLIIRLPKLDNNRSQELKVKSI